MKKIYSAFLLVLIGFSFSLFAGNININPTDRTQLQILENTYSVLKLKNTVGEIEFSDINNEFGIFTKLTIENYGKSMIPGEPELPVFKTLIEIPFDAEIEIKFSGHSIQEIDLAEFGISDVIIPSQEPVSKEFDYRHVNFIKNEELYSTDQFYGQELVNVEILGTMRGVRIARLEIAPVRYNPVLNKLQVFDDLEIEIVFKDANTQLCKLRKENLFSPYFESIYSSVLNYKPIPVDELITNAPITYVIVSDPMFESSLEPFVEWKSQKGYRVIEAYTDDPLVGNTTTSIKAYLEDLYNDSPVGFHPQSFILLVGDIGQVPSFDGVFGFHPADLYYAEYTGDMFPDCYYGRFSANDVTELLPQINKTIEYEKYEFPSPQFLDSALLVAGVANGLDTIWGNGQINYATDNYINEEHGISAFVYPQPEPSGQNYTDLIFERFNNGISYFNYTGHCSSFGFIDPPFTIGHVFQLTNIQKYPLVVGNCCSAAMFNMNCLAEQIVRAENKGALSFVGASNSTYWDEDFWWAVGFKNIGSSPVYDPDHLGFYDSWFHDNDEPMDEWYVTQGQLQVAGNLAVTQSGSSVQNYYWEAYHLMGDPSTTIYLPQPELPEVSHASFIPIGATTFQVTTEPYLYIALSINGELHGAALSNETGLAVVELFEPFQQPGEVDIVVTGQNIQPYFGTVPAILTQVSENISGGNIGYVNIIPNPFQNGFTVEYTLNENSNVNISIINIMGQQIVQLEHSINKLAGDYNTHFNCQDLLPGIYFCKVAANNSTLITKLIRTE